MKLSNQAVKYFMVVSFPCSFFQVALVVQSSAWLAVVICRTAAIERSINKNVRESDGVFISRSSILLLHACLLLSHCFGCRATDSYCPPACVQGRVIHFYCNLNDIIHKVYLCFLDCCCNSVNEHGCFIWVLAHSLICVHISSILC